MFMNELFGSYATPFSAAAVMQANGSFEVVAESSGQWYAMAALTEQMRESLIPASLTQNAFAVLREG